jgi:hypothetical protein
MFFFPGLKLSPLIAPSSRCPGDVWLSALDPLSKTPDETWIGWHRWKRDRRIGGSGVATRTSSELPRVLQAEYFRHPVLGVTVGQPASGTS